MIELAALPSTVAPALLKTLYGVMVSVLKEEPPPKSRRDELSTWVKVATPAVKRFSLNSLAQAVSDAQKGQFDSESFLSLGNELKGAIASFKEEHDVTLDQLNQLRSFASWFRVGSESAYNRLEKTVSTLGESSLNQDFLKEKRSQAPSKKALQAIVKAVSKRAGDKLTPDEAKALKEKKPELFKEYNRLRREFNLGWKEALQTYIRKSGKRMLSYQSVLQYLRSQKLEFTLIEGFEGMVDDLGKLYTTTRKLINGVPNAARFPKVQMNPNYNPKLDDSYVFIAIREDGTKGNFFYTVDYRQNANKEKFGNVDALKDKIKSIRSKWIPLIKEGVSEEKGVEATMLEILLQHSARIGSKGNATDGVPTQGLSTLMVKNVTLKPNGEVLLSYKGKDGVAQKHLIKPNEGPVSKQVAANLAALVKDKKPADPLFAIVRPNGRMVLIRAAMVNRLFKSLGAGGVTVHKLRTLRGTLVFQKEMKALMEKLGDKASKLNEKQAKELFMKLATKVGSLLGHIRTIAGGGTKITGATALAAYIDPSIQVEYWRALGKRPPKYLEKFM